MSNPEERPPKFGDPEFLQSVGSMTISFALLDGALTVVLNVMDTNTPLQHIATLPYSEKVNRLADLGKVEFKRLGGSATSEQTINRLKCDLKSVAALRNSINHDFWTVQDKKLRVKGLRGKGVPEDFPSTKKILKLADRIWDVRSRLAELINEYMALKVEKYSGGPGSGGNQREGAESVSGVEFRSACVSNARANL